MQIISQVSSKPKEHVIVLPTDQYVRAFIQSCAMVTDARYDLTELITEATVIIEKRYGKQCTTVEQMIDRIKQRAQHLYSQYSRHIGNKDAERIAASWITLTVSLYQTYLTAGIYGESDAVDYYFKGLLGYDIVLERYEQDMKGFFVGNPYFSPRELEQFIGALDANHRRDPDAPVTDFGNPTGQDPQRGT